MHRLAALLLAAAVLVAARPAVSGPSPEATPATTPLVHLAVVDDAITPITAKFVEEAIAAARAAGADALVIELDEEPPPPRSPPTSCDIHRATPGADPGRRASTPRTTSSDLFASPSSRASSECISAPRTGKRDTVGTKLVSKSSPKSPPNDLRSSGQAERNPL